MPTLDVPNTFNNNTTADATEVNANFTEIESFVNTNVIQKDGSVAFTAVPTGPGTDPTSDNHLARKAYVDEFAKGVVARATITANQGSIGSTTTDITSLTTGSVTTEAGRDYKVTIDLSVAVDTVSLPITIILADGSNNQLAAKAVHSVSATQQDGFTLTFVHAPGAGSREYKVRAQCPVGGTDTIVAAATQPALILLEDLGPTP